MNPSLKYKKIIIIFQKQYPWEVRIEKFAKSLQAQGSEIMVLCRNMGSQPFQEKVAGITIRRIGTGLPFALSLPVPGNILWTLGISKAAKDFKADLIIGREITVALPAIGVCEKRKIPFILDMAEHYPEAMRSWKKYSRGFAKKLVHDWKIPDQIEKKAVLGSSGILVVCDEQKERLIQEYGVEANRMSVVYNTPLLSAWKNFKKGSEEKKPFRFGYHGVMSDDRDLETVLRGFDLAAAEDPEITFLLAGGGEVEGALRVIASSLKHKDRIRFTGRYKPEELPALYDAVDFGVVSLRVNRFTENTLANKFFDYGALGKPFIFTNLAPLNSIMREMKCGVSFHGGDAESVRDAILKIRKADYSSLSQSGMRAIEKEFNWETDEKKLGTFLSTI